MKSERDEINQDYVNDNPTKSVFHMEKAASNTTENGSRPGIDREFANDCAKTFSELKELRKKEKKDIARSLKEKIGEVPNRLEVKYENPEWWMKDPLMKTSKDLEKRNVLELRASLGLTAPTEVKELSKVPSTTYLESPRAKTLEELKALRKEEMLNQLHQKIDYSHVPREKRMIEREMKNLYYIPEGVEFPTIRQIKENVRIQTNEHNIQTFSKNTIGVHGHELPKFAETKKEYWTIRDSYQPNPKFSTRSSLRMSQRNWVKPDIYDEPIEPKTGTILPRSLSEAKVTDKPNHIWPFQVYAPVEGDEPENSKPKHKYRLSTIVNYFLHSAAKMGISLAPLGDQPGLHMTQEIKESTKTQILPAESGSQLLNSPMLGKSPTVAMVGKKFPLAKVPKSPIRSNGFIKFNNIDN